MGIGTVWMVVWRVGVGWTISSFIFVVVCFVVVVVVVVCGKRVGCLEEYVEGMAVHLECW